LWPGGLRSAYADVGQDARRDAAMPTAAATIN
jgi:hypothetical protein